MKSYLTALGLSIATMIAPITPLILITFGAIILDLYFGLWKVVRLSGWKAIKSRRMSDTITKTLLYVGAIVMIFLAEKFILVDISKNYTNIEFLLTKGFTLFCLITEGKSINESYHAVTGKNLWKNLIIFVQRAREEKDKSK
jgi:hypothetical protein